jgi:hypothetical protein
MKKYFYIFGDTVIIVLYFIYLYYILIYDYVRVG